MRPHLLASSTSTASSIATRLTNPASNRSLTYLLKSQGPLALSANKRLFTNTVQRPNLVKPQANTTTSGQNVRIPSASTEATTTTSTPTAAMSTPISASVFLEHIKKRRTYYQLNKELTISKDRFEEIVKEGLHHIPSSFDSQSNRVLVLFGADHDKFWDITAEALKPIVPADSWANTEARIAGFKAAAASVLFFEDQRVVERMEEEWKVFAEHFATWATQSDAMLQFTLWTAFEAEGLGANLQHYNPLVNDRVAKEWGIEKEWKLNAQLVVGGRIGAELDPKKAPPFDEYYKVAGN